MEEKFMDIVEKLLEMQEELVELKTMKKYLINFLWNAELKDAVDAKKYEGKFGDKLTDTKVYVSDVRAVLGIMPNPEAVAIYKELANRTPAKEDDADE